MMAAIADGGFGRDDLWLPAVLLTAAVVGKSAQFPLHTWLPDAMPGPTPISALIHAATMVAAGVFLVARTYPLFLGAPAALTLLALVAAVTMLLAALYALFTADLKRVLAWSTVSQLAYMFGALAVGAWSAGVLHLLAHGAFKALLFLAAGAVVHAVGSTSMTAMGGLRDKLPVTFLDDDASASGRWPASSRWSASSPRTRSSAPTWDAALHGRLVWPWLAWLLFASDGGHRGAHRRLLPARLAAGLLRQPRRRRPGRGRGARVAEAPPSMKVPLYLLAVPTALGGLVVVYPEAVLGSRRVPPAARRSWRLVMTVLVALTAAVVVRAWRRSGGRDPWRPRVLPQPQVDRVYDVGLVRPVMRLAAARPGR